EEGALATVVGPVAGLRRVGANVDVVAGADVDVVTGAEVMAAHVDVVAAEVMAAHVDVVAAEVEAVRLAHQEGQERRGEAEDEAAEKERRERIHSPSPPPGSKS